NSPRIDLVLMFNVLCSLLKQRKVTDVLKLWDSSNMGDSRRTTVHIID
ncbi:MAG: hypothetical protein ACI9I4_001606, partial [Neolewinella sp.]